MLRVELRRAQTLPERRNQMQTPQHATAGAARTAGPLLHLRITGHVSEAMAPVLTRPALAFVEALEAEFGSRRRDLLDRRQSRTHLDFLTQTAGIRSSAWTVAKAPEDLRDRRVEITGPAERKMMINALNSGA